MHLTYAALALVAVSTYAAPAIAMTIKSTSTSELKTRGHWVREYPYRWICIGLCDSKSCSQEPGNTLWTCNPVPVSTPTPAATLNPPAAAPHPGLIDANNGMLLLKPRQELPQ